MSSDQVARSVARKLRYYMQVERLEDGFDLTGPEIPRRHYVQMKPSPVYSGAALHDKSLKAYVQNGEVKRFLRDLSPDVAQKKPTGKRKKRRKAVVRNLEYHMAKTDFREPPFLARSPSPKRKPSAKAYRTNINRPRPQTAFNTGLTTLRRAAPVGVSPLEAHRLVNTAAKLLVATETVAINVNEASAKQDRKRPSSAFATRRNSGSVNKDALPNVKGSRKGRKSKTAFVEKESGDQVDTAVAAYSEDFTNEDESSRPRTSYKIAIKTGDKPGLPSGIKVKLKIHGDKCDTNWINLTDSGGNELKFQQNQTDEFSMETEQLGQLKALSIGHNKAAPGIKWWVESVEVEDTEEKKAYMFKLDDWIPHNKSSTVGVKRIKLSEVKDLLKDENTQRTSDGVSNLSSSSSSASSRSSSRDSQKPKIEPAEIESVTSSSARQTPQPEPTELDNKEAPPRSPSSSSSSSSSASEKTPRQPEPDRAITLFPSEPPREPTPPPREPTPPPREPTPPPREPTPPPREPTPPAREPTPPPREPTPPPREPTPPPREPTPPPREPTPPPPSDRVQVEQDSLSTEENFLDDLNLIKNPNFTQQTRNPDHWMQYGGCDISVIETEIPFSKNRMACVAENRSAHFAGISQSIIDRVADGARYKLTAQVRLMDSAAVTLVSEEGLTIRAMVQYKLMGDEKFQQIRIQEVKYVKSTSWSTIKGWLELSLIKRPDQKLAAIRICFEGPDKSLSFVVSNVQLIREYMDVEHSTTNAILNGSFNDFSLTPQDWKGVGQSVIKLSEDFSFGKKRGVETIQRPYTYSGVAQSILDTVEPGRHYSFSAQVRLVGTPPDEEHPVQWILKYNLGDSRGDKAHTIGVAKSVSSAAWSKISGELNMNDILVLPSSKLEYATFHLETIPNVNICVADARMIDGGKIIKQKPSVEDGEKDILAIGQKEEDEESFVPSRRSSTSSSSAGEPDSPPPAPRLSQRRKSSSDESEEALDEDRESEPESEGRETPMPQKGDQEDALILKKLHDAVEKGHGEDVRSILKSKPQLVNTEDPEYHLTAAHVAAMHRKPNILKLVNEFDADFNLTSKAGYMPIHYAALNNDVECVKVLHALGASLNEMTVDRHTPLHVAARQGNNEAVKWLMVNGCVLNYRDLGQRTSADLASLHGHDPIANLIVKCVGMLKQNKDIVDTINETDLSGPRPLVVASPDAPKSPFQVTNARGVDQRGDTGRQELSPSDETLIDRLHAAIAQEDQTEIKSILASAPHIINIPSRKGVSAVHVATNCKNPTLIRVLSRLGADLSQPSNSGYYPFHRAVLNADMPTLNTLFGLGVSLNVMTPDRQTGLHLAAERGMMVIVKWLVANGAILNYRNSQQHTPADLANQNNFKQIATLLNECVGKLRRGEDVADVIKNY